MREGLGIGLFDAVPTIQQWFCFVSDETKPAIFLTRRNAIGLGQDTYQIRRSGDANRGDGLLTNGSFAFWIVSSGELMRTLVLVISCITL